MPKPKDKPATFRVEIVLPDSLRPALDGMIGTYGSSESEVARTLVIASLDQFARVKRQIERKKLKKLDQLR
ncbi:MAG: hypothetical protein V1708_02475 [Candidatus Micrarchaeota archaeon]